MLRVACTKCHRRNVQNITLRTRAYVAGAEGSTPVIKYLVTKHDLVAVLYNLNSYLHKIYLNVILPSNTGVIWQLSNISLQNPVRISCYTNHVNMSN
jgi:hypothetical protein